MAGGILQKGLLYSTLGMCLMMFRGILMRQGKSYCSTFGFYVCDEDGR